ncbi:MAG: YraN family protein [Prevotella sp.]
MAQHNDIGKWGEDIAARYMSGKGWFIRHRDWRFDHKDLDLVCIDEDDTTLVFVEVKTRTSLRRGNPVDAVDAAKRLNIINAASAYRRIYKKENRDVRFDIISIVGSPDTEYHIDHVENAFTAFDAFEDYVSASSSGREALSF